MTAEEIIKFLKMEPLPIEGGYFAVTHNSDEQLDISALPSRYKSNRPICSAIYYLVTSVQFSAMHKLPTDELYYFHYGDPLEMLLLGPNGEGVRKVFGLQLDMDQQPQGLAPRDWWQGSRPLPGHPHGFTLVSTSMAPAYAESDPGFGNREELISQYPDYAGLITSLTRLG